MKRRFKLSVMLLAFCTLSTSYAQVNTVKPAERDDTIKQLGSLMHSNYVFPKVGETTKISLLDDLAIGKFNEYSDKEAFAQALTDALRKITNDKHLRVRKNVIGPAPSEEEIIDQRINDYAAYRQRNQGISQVKKLDNNIGYLELRGFAPMEMGKASIDAAMKLLSTSDALIIDLRRNGGGSPEMVQYLCSYFMDEHKLLNRIYWRPNDSYREFWTLDTVGGDKMPDTPVYILTSAKTFSAAEGFSYHMQAHNRATIVGEVTLGGAHPGNVFTINDSFNVFIPVGRSENAITKTNWEGVGVIPQIKVEASATYDKALELATKDAINARGNSNKKYKSASIKLKSLIKSTALSLKEDSLESVTPQFMIEMSQIAHDMTMVEHEINILGYETMMLQKMPKVAVLIFKFNVQKFPHSANNYDSLGSGLMALKRFKEAKASFAKGLQLVDKNNVPLTEEIQANLALAGDKLNNS